MVAEESIFANYTALEQLQSRVEAFAERFSGIATLQVLSSAETGNGQLSEKYEAFRSAWVGNRRSILHELQAAGQVLSGAIATYRAADSKIAGSGSS